MSTVPARSSVVPEPALVVRPWWKYPIVWLMIGGPALVVVASVITTVIAVQGADPVIRPAVSGAEAGSKNALLPAAAARNHAATPAR